MDSRRAVQAFFEVRNGFEGLDVEEHLLGQVLRCVAVRGHDDRDRLACVDHLAAGQQGLPGPGVVGEFVRQVGVAQDGRQSRVVADRVQAHVEDPSMGDGAADEGRVDGIGRLKVGDEAAPAPEEPLVFEPGQACADERGRVVRHGAGSRRSPAAASMAAMIGS